MRPASTRFPAQDGAQFAHESVPEELLEEMDPVRPY